MVQAGYVRSVGLSEVGADTVRRAAAAHPIADLQIEYSLVSRGIEQAILPTCRELRIDITAYGIFSRGLLSDSFSAERRPQPGDIRHRLPRFSEENAQRNAELVGRLREIARARGATVGQLAVAWVASRGADITPLIGARRRDQLSDALAGLSLRLDEDEVRALESAVPP